MKEYTRCKALISLDAIENNFAEMKKNLKEGTKMIAVIKADGYGHGSEQIAHLIEDYDYLWGFATATSEEAFALRHQGIKKPILILGVVFPEDYEELAELEIRIPIMDYCRAEEYAKAAKRVGKPGLVHIALDTGMSRIGFSDTEKSAEEVRRISGIENLEIEGIFTHFARADETDKSPAVVQLDRYTSFVKMIEEKGVQIPLKHCSNSAGLLRLPNANFDIVRAGITIYGIYPSGEVERENARLKPAMSLVSHVSYVKEVKAGTAIGYGGTYVTERETSIIATVPVGYADGYPRMLSNKGYVLINGHKAYIRGRVCMDQFMVDVTEIPEVKIGDEVILLGSDGIHEITADEIGDLSGRFSYELVCDITKRVPRIFMKNGQRVGELTFFA